MAEKGNNNTTSNKRKSQKERKAELKAEKKARKQNAKAELRAKKAEVREARARNSKLGNFARNTISNVGGSDRWLIVLIFVISTFGIAMVESAGYYQTINTSQPSPLYYMIRQTIFVVGGWGLLFVFANLDYHIYMKFGEFALIVSIGLLVLVLLIGTTSHNAQRWISILGIRITPSEISKLAMIVFTSTFLVKNPKGARTLTGLFVLAAAMGAHFILIVRQPNLSTAIVIVMIMFAIMIVAGMNLLLIGVPAIAAVLGYFYIIQFKSPYHWYQRLTSFRDPLADLQGDGYQVSQGLIALGNGGLKGLGFGNSVTKNMFLPEPQNDFILAILGEEFGFIGFVILMGVYMLMLFRLFSIALNAKDKLGFYLATGVAVMLGLQVIINVAVVTSSMPATGITLPFISYGGTSILVFMMSMGIALNISKSNNRTEGTERKVKK